MSAFPPKADIHRNSPNVSFGPKPEPPLMMRPLASDNGRIELVELHNTSMFSARKHFKNRAGEWQPRKMGLMFAIERLPDVVARFESALNRARAERLLP